MGERRESCHFKYNHQDRSLQTLFKYSERRIHIIHSYCTSSDDAVLSSADKLETL